MTTPRETVMDVVDEIRNTIDRYEWKHSWHLPKDAYGYIAWTSKDTLDEVQKILDRYAQDAAFFAAKCLRLAAIVRARREQP
jgi:hypothetical protein